MVRSRSASPARRGVCAPLFLVAFLALGPAGCGRSEPAPDPLKAQRSAVQKAKDVNDVVTGAAAERRNEIVDAETK
ncbi:MAG TPA: hypothetical protein VMG60_00265 [Burkholderiaceae bacterium]|nr:hypothetical protein [Burkholderiaceae bacterium]